MPPKYNDALLSLRRNVLNKTSIIPNKIIFTEKKDKISIYNGEDSLINSFVFLINRFGLFLSERFKK